MNSTDVVIVGGGPVGLTLSIALSRAGVSNTIIERDDAPYQLPRAIVMDAEIHRSLLNHGLGSRLSDLLEPLRAADFVTASGEHIMGIDIGEQRALGLPPVCCHFQPELDAMLREVAVEFGAVLLTGNDFARFEETESAVIAHMSNGATVEGRWLVGCDGASSSVRRQAGIDLVDLMFDQDWLVVDVELNTRDAGNLPDVVRQICDPARPTTLVRGVKNFYRWEFQLQPDEDRSTMNTPESIWQLLSPWITVHEARLVRSAVYRFHAVVASTMRQGRVFLAGDSAHQMPPFLGQGLNSGMRDAFNLAWKMALVKEGLCPDALLDTYSTERIPHSRSVVEHAADMGRLIDQLAGRQSHGIDHDAGYGGARPQPKLSDGCVTGDHPWVGRVYGQWHLIEPQHVGATTWVVVTGQKVAGEIAQQLQDLVPSPYFPLEVRAMPHTDADHPSFVLIRPDGYVAGVADDPSGIGVIINSIIRRVP